MTGRAVVAAFFLAASMVGCAGHPWDPFLVPRPAVRQETQVVAVSSVLLYVSDLKVSDTLLARFDSLIVEALRGGGRRIVPARVVDSVWNHLRDSAGGLFDPKTGVRDSARIGALDSLWRGALYRTYGAGAVLSPRIVVVRASFSDGTAHWDGASESFQSLGAKILTAFAGVHGSGQTPALSLLVGVYGASGKAIYLDAGGIQLLERPTRNGFERVPTAELLTDSVRVRQAVALALGPLVNPDSTTAH